jgi:hypothetical protein
MKYFLSFVLMSHFLSQTLIAQDNNSTESQSESNITSNTKKALRKVGRKARDGSCEWTEDKTKCLKERAQHMEANKNDVIDTKKRKLDKAANEYQEAVDSKIK